MDLQDNIEEEARARRMQRIKKMQEEKQRQLMLRQKISQAAPFVVAVVLFVLVVWAGIGLLGRRTDSREEDIGRQGQEGTISDDESIAVNDNIAINESIAVNDSNVVNDRNVVNPEVDIPNQAEQRIPETEFAHALPYTEGMESLKHYQAEATKDTLSLGDEIISSYAVLIDLDSNNILTGKG